MPRIDFEQVVKPDIEYTIALIKQLHAGQTDQTGKPYVTHPQRVAQNVRRLFPDCSDDVVMAALLHDAIEDCGISETDLRQKNYSPACIEIVSLVTKNTEDKRDYGEVIGDLVASGNREAMMVKIADNMDNLHPRRVEELYRIDPEKAQRLGERYKKSIEKLTSALGIDKDHVFGLIEAIPSPDRQILFAKHQEERTMNDPKYKYFTNGVWPIRAIYDDQDRLRGTETPNREAGEIELNMYWISKVFEDRSGDIEEITKEEFDQMVIDFLSQKKTARPEPRGTSDLDTGNASDFGEYRYWKRFSSVTGGLDTPIRVLRSKGGNSMGAETIVPETGQMVSRIMLLGDIDRDEWVEEIDEAEFNRLCEAHIAAYQKKTARPEPGGMD